MKALLLGMAVVVILATAMPLLRHEAWWIRIFDFPRVQIGAVGLSIFVTYVLVWDVHDPMEFIVLGLLLVAVLHQAYRIFPYTPLASTQVAPASVRHEKARLSLIFANVLMHNRNVDRLLEVIRACDPDIILTVETDAWWQERLGPLKNEYPYAVEHPLDNTYGMILYSRLELVGPEVRFLIREDIPSIHTRLRLPSGDLIRLHCLHPEPPSPNHAKDSVERDAELLVVARQFGRADVPTIVVGDLNDVAWSHTTRLFQRVSGLLDPRIGRGMYNSFHATAPLLRWPLDHVFHSDHFKLISIRLLEAFGSDHFPLFVALSLEPATETDQKKPVLEKEDLEETVRKLEAVDQRS